MNHTTPTLNSDLGFGSFVLTDFSSRRKKMAFRAARQYWRSVVVANGNRSFASSTTPKMKLFNPTADSIQSDRPRKASVAMKGDFAPIVVVLGMVVAAVSIGVHTAKQQLVYSPAVQVNKKRRESVPEVDDPDYVVDGADKFVNKSFLRKVAHIQDHDNPTLSDPVRPNPYTRSREIESLKSVGAQERRGH